MKCDICGNDATVHLTTVDTPSGKKTQASYCEDHADRAGISPEKVKQHKRKMESALESLTDFVKTNRRTPSEDEMTRIRIPNVSDQFQAWKKFAEQLLSQQGGQP